MPVLQNPRHESFAQALAKGKTADEAYVLAGYKPDRGHASRLAANGNIAKRVVELQTKAAEKAEWTAADRLLGLKAIYDKALDQDQRTAIAAIAEANKMQGSYAPSKHHHAGPGGGPIPTVDLTSVDSDDLERLEALFGPLAGSSGDDAEADQGGEGA